MGKKRNICENCTHFGPQKTVLNQFGDPEPKELKMADLRADCHFRPPDTVGMGLSKVISMCTQTPRDNWCHFFAKAAKKPS